MTRTRRRLRRTIAAVGGGAVLVSGAVVATAPMGAEAAAPSRARVSLENYMFQMKTVTIRRGGTVTWTWKDNAFHNVTSLGSKHFRSSTTKKRGSYTVRFTKAGTYSYNCSIHSFMVGKVIVK